MMHHALSRRVLLIRSLLARHKRVAAIAQSVLNRMPVLQDAMHALARGDPAERYQRWIEAYDTLDATELARMPGLQLSRDERGLLSLLIPVQGVDAGALETLADSLARQIHERWEAHLVCDRASRSSVWAFFSGASERDSRFRNLHADTDSVAAAWNAALESAAGDVAVLIHPRCTLRPHALLALSVAFSSSDRVCLAYADDDVVDADGVRSEHYFRPEWNPTLLLSQNYLGGLVAFRRSLALAVGGCRDELDGEHAWGLFLRMTAEASPESIRHLPYVLSHWQGARPIPSPRADRAHGARAHEERLGLLGLRARVEPVGERSYRPRYALPAEPPAVSVVIPTTCAPEVLRPCLDGILDRTSYPRLEEVILVVNRAHASAADRRAYVEGLAVSGRVRILTYEDRPFNFSWANNFGVREARGALVCFLNDDTEAIGSDWLSAMVSHAVRPGVAAVGAMLYFPGARIQHAGVVLGVGGVAAHSFAGKPRGTAGYHDRALVDQEVSCVTAACMLVRRDVFLGVGGFDERLPIAFNDVDLCLRLRQAGWRIVWTPSAELYHRESFSIGPHNAGSREDQWTASRNLMQRRWGEELLSDPYYNPNLSLDPLELWEPAFPPRVPAPWRASGI